MERINYTGSYNGGTSFTSSYLIGKDVVSIVKDGQACSKIITVGTPTGKQAKYTLYSGTITFAVPLELGEEVYVLFQNLPI